jgi:hypothetical protein
MQRQTETNWCWSAVATSVGLFFVSTAGWTQCSVACGVLGQTTCCTDPGSATCNVYGFLNRSLTFTKSFAGWTDGKCSMPTLESKINVGQPVCLRCAWDGGGAHFLSVYGYDDVAGTVNVADPIYGVSTQNFDTFPSSYQGGGAWTDTYFTSASP